MDLLPLLALAETAARAAGDRLRAKDSSFQGVVSETGRDIKLAADHAAENVILSILREGSDIPVLAEESGSDETLGSQFWVVDPLDGSANYNRGIPLCAVSIALVRNGEPCLGVIHDFNADALYAGAEGFAATLNSMPLSVSDVDVPAQAILATGLPVLADYSETALIDMATGFAAWKKVRMLGSAAIAAAYVGAGRVDRYAEAGARLWDVAAGMAIVKAAGGRAVLSPGALQAPRTILIDNGRLPL